MTNRIELAAGLTSAAHTDEDVDRTLFVVDEVLSQISKRQN